MAESFDSVILTAYQQACKIEAEEARLAWMDALDAFKTSAAAVTAAPCAETDITAATDGALLLVAGKAYKHANANAAKVVTITPERQKILIEQLVNPFYVKPKKVKSSRSSKAIAKVKGNALSGWVPLSGQYAAIEDDDTEGAKFSAKPKTHSRTHTKTKKPARANPTAAALPRDIQAHL